MDPLCFIDPSISRLRVGACTPRAFHAATLRQVLRKPHARPRPALRHPSASCCFRSPLSPRKALRDCPLRMLGCGGPATSHPLSPHFRSHPTPLLAFLSGLPSPLLGLAAPVPPIRVPAFSAMRPRSPAAGFRRRASRRRRGGGGGCRPRPGPHSNAVVLCLCRFRSRGCGCVGVGGAAHCRSCCGLLCRSCAAYSPKYLHCELSSQSDHTWASCLVGILPVGHLPPLCLPTIGLVLVRRPVRVILVVARIAGDNHYKGAWGASANDTRPSCCTSSRPNTRTSIHTTPMAVVIMRVAVAALVWQTNPRMTTATDLKY